MSARGDNEARVLLIYTGGTIGMEHTQRGLAPAPGVLRTQLRQLATFYDPNEDDLVLPALGQGHRIRMEMFEYTPLLDSSNMSLQDWARIARDIEAHADRFDGFVVLHGTDTMSYTASALSFMLENLHKPVVLTGSQMPLHAIRNDATNNLLGALTIAGNCNIPEVGLFFRSRLYRGNRTQKIDTQGFEAFGSHNYAPLAEMGYRTEVYWSRVLPMPEKPLRVHPITERNVGLLRLFPGITSALVKNILQAPLRGCVLESFGSGNAPDNRPDLMAALAEATERGVVIVNCTQCQRGGVRPQYATGKMLDECGVVSGADMTPEAALTKLAYLLSREDMTSDQVKAAMSMSLRGELTDTSVLGV